MTGRFADGLGGVRTVKDRVTFNPFPHYSMAVWLMTQMRRWNMIKEDIDYKSVAQRVMLATQARQIMADDGVAMPEPGFRIETIMGKPFDSSKV